MNELALFAGAGGGLLATKWLLGWRTVCYVEWEQYCIDVLKQRIADGCLDDAPIWDDARTFDGRPWRGCVDIVTAGFPCQPFSGAGKQLAGDDPRNMWPDTIRIIGEVRPPFVLLENVSNLLAGSHGYFGQILGELAESGYDAGWRVLSAAEVGAPHKRDRVFIAAHAKSTGIIRKHRDDGTASSERHQDQQESNSGCTADVAHSPRQQSGWGDYSALRLGSVCQEMADAPRLNGERPKSSRDNGGQPERATGDGYSDVADASGTGLEKWKSKPGDNGSKQSPAIGDGWWSTEPNVGRVADGVASRVDRLKAIGNGQVPLVVTTVWGLLMDILELEPA